MLWITSYNNANGNKVFKTMDGGASWVNLTTSTIDGSGYQNIVHQGGTDGGVYILGSGGRVYYRNNSMADWVGFADNLPNSHRPMLSFPFYKDGKLRSAGNRGIWQTDFYEEGVPVAQPTVDRLSGACGRDTFYFDDFSDFKQDGSHTWNWTFGGSPVYVSSTTVRNPKVVFGAPGSHSFSLTVANSKGSSSKSGGIQITSNACSPDTVPGKVLTTSAGGYGIQSKPLNITTNTLTISCWIKPAGIQYSYTGIITSYNAGATGLNFTDNNRLGYHWEADPGSYFWNGGPVAPVNQWSHVALVVTPASVTIYLNGIGYTRNATHNAITFDQPFIFCRDRDSPDRVYNGQMDEVCIYNKALSQQEIRELMHLTRNNPNPGALPGRDVALLAYYQFNENPAYPCYDKAGFSHVNLSGDAVKTELSTAPVGGGVFQRMNVSAGGSFNFSLPGVEIGFPATGTKPNGDVVVTRLNVPPDEPAGASVLPNSPVSYYIIRNFGSNQTFTPLTNIRFSNVQGITAAMAIRPAALKLYKRPSNDAGATWGMPVDEGDAVTHTNGTGTIEFASGLNVTGFSQFSMSVDESALPLTLLSFTVALQQDKTVLLRWHTAAEVNFSGFEIERSADGISFDKLAFIQGTGGGMYSSRDLHPATGINYYRLKMIDANGRLSYSPIRSIRITPNSQLFTVYPNPTSGWVELRVAGNPANHAGILIYNQPGQLLRVIDLNNIGSSQRIRFNLNVPAGIYGARIMLDNGYSETHTIIVTD